MDKARLVRCYLFHSRAARSVAERELCYLSVAMYKPEPVCGCVCVCAVWSFVTDLSQMDGCERSLICKTGRLS